MVVSGGERREVSFFVKVAEVFDFCRVTPFPLCRALSSLIRPFADSRHSKRSIDAKRESSNAQKERKRPVGYTSQKIRQAIEQH